MKKPDLSEILKKAEELKSKASRFSKEAKATAGTVKEVVSAGVSTSKVAMDKARGILTPEKISQGLELTSKGMDLASKGAKQVASTMDKASHSVRKLGDRIKNK